MTNEQIFTNSLITDQPKCMEQITSPSINLAILKNPFSRETEVYLDNLDLSEIKVEAFTDYYKRLAMRVFDIKTSLEELDDFTKCLPAKNGKEALLRDMQKLKDLFMQATGVDEVRLNLMLFSPKPDDGSLSAPGYWHYDGGHFVGITTLKGDAGTVVKHAPAGQTLREGKNKSYFDNAQSILVRDFGIFGALNSGKPLLHTTPPYPMSRDMRLVVLMDNDR